MATTRFVRSAASASLFTLLVAGCASETLYRIGPENQAADLPTQTEPGAGPTADGGTDGAVSTKDSGSGPPGNPPGKDGGAGADSSSPPGGPAVPATFTGIGSSFAACNGRGRAAYYGPSVATQIVDVTTAWIFGTDSVSGRGNKVFGYDATQITTSAFPLVGSTGQRQVKLAIDAPQATLVAGQQYGGSIALATWNPSTSQWSTTAGSRTVIVQVLDFSADANAWSNGAWCAGRLVAHVESLVDGSGADRLDFDFYAPILTPSFPH